MLSIRRNDGGPENQPKTDEVQRSRNRPIPLDLSQSSRKYVKYSGFRQEIYYWLKAYRLHKYIDTFSDFNFYKLIYCNRKTLVDRQVTEGACGRIHQAIIRLRERPIRLKLYCKYLTCLRYESIPPLQIHIGICQLSEAVFSPFPPIPKAKGKHNIALFTISTLIVHIIDILAHLLLGRPNFINQFHLAKLRYALGYLVYSDIINKFTQEQGDSIRSFYEKLESDVADFNLKHIRLLNDFSLHMCQCCRKRDADIGAFVAHLDSSRYFLNVDWNVVAGYLIERASLPCSCSECLTQFSHSEDDEVNSEHEQNSDSSTDAMASESDTYPSSSPSSPSGARNYTAFWVWTKNHWEFDNFQSSDTDKENDEFLNAKMNDMFEALCIGD